MSGGFRTTPASVPITFLPLLSAAPLPITFSDLIYICVLSKKTTAVVGTSWRRSSHVFPLIPMYGSVSFLPVSHFRLFFFLSFYHFLFFSRLVYYSLQEVPFEAEASDLQSLDPLWQVPLWQVPLWHSVPTAVWEYGHRPAAPILDPLYIGS